MVIIHCIIITSLNWITYGNEYDLCAFKLIKLTKSEWVISRTILRENILKYRKLYFCNVFFKVIYWQKMKDTLQRILMFFFVFLLFFSLFFFSRLLILFNIFPLCTNYLITKGLAFLILPLHELKRKKKRKKLPFCSKKQSKNHCSELELEYIQKGTFSETFYKSRNKFGQKHKLLRTFMSNGYENLSVQP